MCANQDQVAGVHLGSLGRLSLVIIRFIIISSIIMCIYIYIYILYIYIYICRPTMY